MLMEIACARVLLQLARRNWILVSHDKLAFGFDSCEWNHFPMDSIVMTRFSHAFSCACCTGFRSFWQGTCFNGYHLKCDVLGCCLHWHEEWQYVLYWWRFRRSAHEVKRNWKKDTQWAVADQPLVACNVMPIREMLLMMGVIISILFRLRTMQVCSRTRANLAWHVPSVLLLVSSMHISAKRSSCTEKNFKATHHSFLNVFFVAHFILTTVSYGLPSPFRSPSIDYLLNWSYYSTMLAGNNTSVLYHITLPGAWISSVTLRLFCSRLIALVLLLLSCASVRSQGYAMCFKCGSAQQ